MSSVTSCIEIKEQRCEHGTFRVAASSEVLMREVLKEAKSVELLIEVNHDW